MSKNAAEDNAESPREIEPASAGAAEFDRGFGADDELHFDSAGPRPARTPVHRVYGSKRNFERFGLPSDVRGQERLCYYFYPTWRSQLLNLILFFFALIASIALSRYFPKYLVLPGKLFTIGDTVVRLHLPLLSLIPGFVLGKILFTIYNSRYIIDESGVEGQVGLVSFYLRQPRLRYEDIRGVEPEQSILERILGIGRVLIGSAMTEGVEIVMEGVADPRAIQLLINKERDRQLRVRGGSATQFLTGD